MANAAPEKKTVKTVKAKKKTFIERVNLFDHLVYQRKFSPALKLMLEMLGELERGAEGFGQNLNDRGPAAEKYATIFCAAVTRLYADAEFAPGGQALYSLASLKRPLMQAFEVSGFRGTEHLIHTIGKIDENGKRAFNRTELTKLFLGLSVNFYSPALVQLLKQQQPDLAWPMVLGLLSEQIVWSKRGQVARRELLTSVEWLGNTTPSYQVIRNIGPAYMGCSYDESGFKHDVKRSMNKVIRGFMEKAEVTDVVESGPRRAVKKRPTVLILAELYDSHHAMHRCYGPSIRSLQGKFKTILMTPSGKIDSALTDMFDKIDPMPFDAAKPKAFIDKVKSYRPDIIYFPSIGMRLLSILASNVRMAPIQIMTFGHPATTHSPMIDYVVLDAKQIGDENTVSEKILYRDSVPRFELRSDAAPIKPILRENPAVVRIAVPAWSRKVSPLFLQACQAIENRSKKAGKAVEFWFFPNGVGSLYQGFARRIETMVSAKVFPRTNYNNYIEMLNKCDIFLSTFPFGATNGIVDAIRQGIPVVNLTGPEVHEANDSHIVERFEQPDWLTTKTPAEYVDAVVKLVVDGKLRSEIGRALLLNDPDSKLVAQQTDGDSDFVKVFQAAYKHHETFQQSDRKSWSYAELEQLAQE